MYTRCEATFAEWEEQNKRVITGVIPKHSCYDAGINSNPS